MSENLGSNIEGPPGTLPKSHLGVTAVRVPPSRVDLEVGGTVDGMGDEGWKKDVKKHQLF